MNSSSTSVLSMPLLSKEMLGQNLPPPFCFFRRGIMAGSLIVFGLTVVLFPERAPASLPARNGVSAFGIPGVKDLRGPPSSVLARGMFTEFLGHPGNRQLCHAK